MGTPASPSRSNVYDYSPKAKRDSDIYNINKYSNRQNSSNDFAPDYAQPSKADDYWQKYKTYKPKTEPRTEARVELRASPTFDSGPIRKYDNLNETFTSQKAKRNVSDYQNEYSSRPTLSRERGSSTATTGNFSLIGLENIGNTWYFNVVLQWLFHLPTFNTIFIDGTYQRMINSGQRSNMWEAYAELLLKTRENSKSGRSSINRQKSIQDYVSTKDFKYELVKNCPDFKGYSQHDSHEFLTSLFDLMSKELNRVRSKPKYKELKVSSKDSINKQAAKWAKHHKETEDSHLSDIFEGQTVTEVKCRKCENSSISFNTSMFLHLDISSKQRSQMMEEIVSSMSDPETIDDYKWSKCKKVTMHTKRTFIYQAPKILVVHLKRFEIGYYSAKKITTMIEMAKSLTIPCQDSSSVEYDLLSIVHHSGSLNSGHYYWEIKDPSSDKWHMFNDESVVSVASPVSESGSGYRRESSKGNTSSKTSYIMFYEMK